MKKIALLVLSLIYFGTTFGSEREAKDIYQKAFSQLKQMLEGKAEYSFKKAVFITENAYLDGQLSYEQYEFHIDRLVQMANVIAASGDLQYTGKDKQSVTQAWSVFRVIKDSISFQFSSDDNALHTFQKFPFTYDMEDFWGESDWTKMFVSKLLGDHSGNCHSLPALYKIIADELKVPAYLAMAPNHTYIKQWSDEMGWYNTELTTGRFPYDAAIKWNSYIKTEAIVNGLYMDTLSQKQNLAYIITDLAQGYIRKVGYTDIRTPINWLDIAIENYPNYINALILRAELLKVEYENMMISKNANHFNTIWDNKFAIQKFKELESAYLQIHELGYRRMPKEMYLNWLFRINEDTTRQAFKFETPQPFKDFGFEVITATAGFGENAEFHDQDSIFRIGSIELNILSGRIIRFIKDIPNDEMPDNIISRMYDPALGKWWQIDPATDMLEMSSPYVYNLNNPINYVDPDGQLPIFINGKVDLDSKRADDSYWSTQLLTTIRNSGIANPGGQLHFVDGDQYATAWSLSDGFRMLAKGGWADQGNISGNRVKAGVAQANRDWKTILSKLAKDPQSNKIVEKIQIYSHSRGSAFATGYVEALMKLISDNSHLFADPNSVIDYVLHLGPHQSGLLTAKADNAFSMHHDDDWLSGNKIKGLKAAFSSDVGQGMKAAHDTDSFSNEVGAFINAFINSASTQDTIDNFVKAAKKKYGITITVN